MKRFYLSAFLILTVLVEAGITAISAQTTVNISPQKDNILYPDNIGALSNGTGELVFAGGEEALKISMVVNGFTCYPNPFNEQTTLRYRVLKTSEVNIKVCNILGQEIVTLVNEFQEQGEKTVVLNMAGIYDASGRPGIYYAILTTGFERHVIKLFQAR
jgi:hypothetical protein